ncbi:flagellar biosynthesis chaperone [Serpentinimonas maccroryi]|uniref:Flagellar FliJ protein n=1 Tax=Serpentinimonas maccroryi TaxID=1458426 RepID=A0A060NUA9_9BURK|nr:flagellar export protein FliJ [Serpentinimonas maccroryi]MBA4252909.1 flagellar export protein FliJ [Comamonadaceae bacterium]OYX59914.1 MAG: flagellar export protein FliJ [Comamonadaceae bacterium 32-67-11]BAO82489.1 flagellar biosynthesis chaperone [Serpentinimonas maccroryi]
MKTAEQDLSVVLDVALRKRDQALQALAQIQHEQRQALLQLNQLQGYCAETHVRWSERAANGFDGVQLHTHRVFMGKLEHAQNYQQTVLEQIAHRLQQGQQRVYEAERELASLRKFQQRRHQVWLLQQQRKEQKSNDEMAAVQHRLHADSHPWRSTP